MRPWDRSFDFSGEDLGYRTPTEHTLYLTKGIRLGCGRRACHAQRGHLILCGTSRRDFIGKLKVESPCPHFFEHIMAHKDFCSSSSRTKFRLEVGRGLQGTEKDAFQQGTLPLKPKLAGSLAELPFFGTSELFVKQFQWQARQARKVHFRSSGSSG